jgi:SAM-dependent methyltransferase
MSQLRHARRNHRALAAWVQGDGARLPFRDGAFDKIYSSWFLEHLPRPVDVLREVHRVLAPSGSCLFIEVDNTTLRTSPECPDVTAAQGRMDEVQRRGGGDPYIGPRLEAYFRQAGFTLESATGPGPVEIRHADFHGTGRDPAFFRAVVAEWAEIYESLDEALGPDMLPVLRRAAAQLRALPGTPGGEFFFRGYVALGHKTQRPGRAREETHG